jgi:hypothetical protein
MVRHKLARAGRAFALALAPGLALVGCNTVDDTAEATMARQEVARPAAIVVQEFAISPDAPMPGGSDAKASEAEQAGDRFSDSLASHLVAAISAMGLPAVRADAPLPPGGSVVTLEGRFVSVAGGDSAESAIVSLADSWPDVVVDVEIYDTSETGDRLFEDMEIRIADTNPAIPAGEPAGVPSEPAAHAGAGATISPAIQAKLDAAAKDGADAIAKQLAPFFADQGWIPLPAGS